MSVCDRQLHFLSVAYPNHRIHVRTVVIVQITHCLVDRRMLLHQKRSLKQFSPCFSPSYCIFCQRAVVSTPQATIWSCRRIEWNKGFHRNRKPIHFHTPNILQMFTLLFGNSLTFRQDSRPLNNPSPSQKNDATQPNVLVNMIISQLCQLLDATSGKRIGNQLVEHSINEVGLNHMRFDVEKGYIIWLTHLL